MNVQQPLFLQTLEYEKTETSRLPQLNETSGIRTPDNLIKSQVLYRLSYTPLLNYLNAQSRNRTNDTRIFSPLLYQLSYLGFFLMPKA